MVHITEFGAHILLELILHGHTKLEVSLDNEGSAYRTTPACYYCIINASDPSIKAIDDYAAKNSVSGDYVSKRRKAYYSALARQKLLLSKSSSFINGSGELK